MVLGSYIGDQVTRSIKNSSKSSIDAKEHTKEIHELNE